MRQSYPWKKELGEKPARDAQQPQQGGGRTSSRNADICPDRDGDQRGVAACAGLPRRILIQALNSIIAVQMYM